MIDTPAFAWGNAAPRLAAWTQEHLVNRTDVYGRYTPEAWREPGKSNNYTAPKKEQRIDGALTMEIIKRHFRGEDRGHLIGLHAISRGSTCRSLVVDIDRHSDADPATPEDNFNAAVGWWIKLMELGFHPLLLDSNGAGGFHLLTIFGEPAPSRRVFDFGRWLITDHAERGLQQAPEIFPKQPDVNPNRPYGSWWRLPGRHHTRDHWTKVWDGNRWLEGREAVGAILAVAGDPPALIPDDVNIPVQTAGVARPGRVGVGPGPRPHGYTSPYDADHWLDVLQGREAGGRHEALLQLAGHLLGHRLDPVVVEEICVLWNEVRNQPGKPEEVIRRTVQDLVQRDAAASSRAPGQTGSATTTYRM